MNSIRFPFVVTALWLAALPVMLAEEPASQPVAGYADQIQPLLVKYCHACHGTGKSEAELNLERYANPQQILAGRVEWLKVLGQVRAQAMPPADATDAPRPSPAEYEQIALAR